MRACACRRSCSSRRKHTTASSPRVNRSAITRLSSSSCGNTCSRIISTPMAFHCIRCNAEIDRSFKACPHCGEPVTEFLRRYLEEPIDGKYRIVGRLGAGGMGEVYRVEHTYLGATRVVKVIRPQISETEDAHER